MKTIFQAGGAFVALALCGAMFLTAQEPPREERDDADRPAPRQRREEGERRQRGPGERGPGERGPGERGPGDRGPNERGDNPNSAFPGGGFGGPPGGFPGGFPGGPPNMEDQAVVDKFDADKNGYLTGDELTKAREFAKTLPRRGPGGPGGPGGRGPGGGPPGGPGGPPGGFPGGPPGGFPGGPFGGNQEPVSPGKQIAPSEVEPIADKGLYDPTVLRTIFFNFPAEDWEAMLQDFARTDVEVPATMIVDGKEYKQVGVHFRGMSSMGVGMGRKHSLGVSINLADPEQRLYGYKTLNLLNAHTDPSFLRTVLYFDAVREHIPAPKANFVRVVINGENWGVFVNAQQFNKEFVAENYGNDKGARWKVRGSPGGGGGLAYDGDDVANYKRRYTIKSKDDAKSWQALVNLCKVLNETPIDKLEEELPKVLDVESALWFIALDNALINNDGYWVRASDYTIYQDVKGLFHVIPHDANETFQAAHGGPGMGGRGMGGRGGRDQGGPPGERPRDGERPQGDRPREGAPRNGGEGDRPNGGRPEGDAPRDGGRRGGPGGPGEFPGGPGGPPGMGGGMGVELDPLIGLNDASKPLRSRLLAVPAWKKKYLENVRTIALEHLDWAKLKPSVDAYRALISKHVEEDTRKLSSFAAFEASAEGGEGREGRERTASLKSFVEQRQKYLLDHPEIKALSQE